MKIHLIPNSHMDPVWLWNKYEGIDEVLNTFRSACDRMDEYPDLTFSASSIQFYVWVKKYDGVLFERIKKFVTDGRWEISGGWWIEPDTNLPLEVSFKKHAELSKKFMQDNFIPQEVISNRSAVSISSSNMDDKSVNRDLPKYNIDTKVAFVPDTFGHPAVLPKILAETGFKYFVFCRPSMEEKPDLPSNLFYWEYEGHKVLAYRLKNHYTQRGEIDVTCDDEYNKSTVNGYFFGIGNHGGGPSIVEIDYYEKLMLENPNVDMGYSTCRNFFEDAEKNVSDIPVYSGDLHMHAVGCYSVLRKLKQKIRTSEHLLDKAERIVAQTRTSATPCECVIEKEQKAKLDKMWEKVLFNQFHDILPGSCSEDAEIDALNQLGGVISECEDLIYDAFKRKSLSVPVKVREGEMRLFNSLPYDVRKPIQLELSDISYKRTELFDSKGNKIVKQDVVPGVRTLFSKKWEFIDTIPANGFKSYSFDTKERDADNDKQQEYFTEVKKSEKYIAESIAFVVLDDNSDTWSHGVQKYNTVKGSFEEQSSCVGDGPVSQKIYKNYKYGNSSVDLIYSCYNELPGTYLDINVNWAEHRSIIKMELDLDILKTINFSKNQISKSNSKQTVEQVKINTLGYSIDSYFMMQGAGGAVKRNTDGVELPLHHWIWCPQNNTGFALIQNGAFACDCNNGKLRINLVRSSLYGFHDPYVINNINPQLDTDQGIHNFKFLLLPQTVFNPNELDRQAEIFLEDFAGVAEGYRK